MGSVLASHRDAYDVDSGCVDDLMTNSCTAIYLSAHRTNVEYNDVVSYN
jgi:hypothetical protein